MDLNTLDRKSLKAIIREVMEEDISLFKRVIKEILIDEKILLPSEDSSREERVKQLIDNNFDQYEDVFKALA
jgi:hypothetical protein